MPCLTKPVDGFNDATRKFTKLFDVFTEGQTRFRYYRCLVGATSDRDDRQFSEHLDLIRDSLSFKGQGEDITVNDPAAPRIAPSYRTSSQ